MTNRLSRIELEVSLPSCVVLEFGLVELLLVREDGSGRKPYHEDGLLIIDGLFRSSPIFLTAKVPSRGYVHCAAWSRSKLLALLCHPH